MIMAWIKLLVFPGLLFLLVFATVLEYLDRKIYARMQNRQGPQWYQPSADFLKLFGKKAIIPNNAGSKVFRLLPLLSLTTAAAAFMNVPVVGMNAAYAFQGDLVVVLYLLTIPTLCLFMAGWNSHSVYSITGSFRTLTQMFSYEVPLFMGMLSPAIVAGTWSLSEISSFYAAHPGWILYNLPALFVVVVAAQGKLERAPFDAPEAETEIAGGALVEYGGRYLAAFRLAADVELVVVVSLIAALFLPFFTGVLVVDFLLYLLKVLIVLVVMSGFRAIMARTRVDQNVRLFWRALTPVAVAQMVLSLVMKGVLTL